MRSVLLLMLATLAAAIAGCSGLEPAEAATDPQAPAMAGNATIEPLHWEADFLVGADPFNFVPASTPVGGGSPCSTDVSACRFHDFTVPGNASGNETYLLTATLAWGLAANDLDLYLYQGGTEVSQDGINSIDPFNPTAFVGGAQQILRHDAPPGEYTFWVVIWNGAADAYTLDVAFAPGAGA